MTTKTIIALGIFATMVLGLGVSQVYADTYDSSAKQDVKTKWGTGQTTSSTEKKSISYDLESEVFDFDRSNRWIDKEDGTNVTLAYMNCSGTLAKISSSQTNSHLIYNLYGYVTCEHVYDHNSFEQQYVVDGWLQIPIDSSENSLLWTPLTDGNWGVINP